MCWRRTSSSHHGSACLSARLWDVPTGSQFPTTAWQQAIFNWKLLSPAKQVQHSQPPSLCLPGNVEISFTLLLASPAINDWCWAKKGTKCCIWDSVLKQPQSHKNFRCSAPLRLNNNVLDSDLVNVPILEILEVIRSFCPEVREYLYQLRISKNYSSKYRTAWVYTAWPGRGKATQEQGLGLTA